jgi:hypothetical protein
MAEENEHSPGLVSDAFTYLMRAGSGIRVLAGLIHSDTSE